VGGWRAGPGRKNLQGIYSGFSAKGVGSGKKVKARKPRFVYKDDEEEKGAATEGTLPHSYCFPMKPGPGSGKKKGGG